ESQSAHQCAMGPHPQAARGRRRHRAARYRQVIAPAHRTRHREDRLSGGLAGTRERLRGRRRCCGARQQSLDVRGAPDESTFHLSDNRAKEQASAARYGLEAEETLSDPAPGGIFRPLRHAPAYRALSARIERMILSGQLKPGDSLPTETALAERFGVNRSTVREAIRLLEQEGLVSRTTGRRLQVDMPGLFDLAPRASRALLLQHVTF